MSYTIQTQHLWQTRQIQLSLTLNKMYKCSCSNFEISGNTLRYLWSCMLPRGFTDLSYVFWKSFTRRTSVSWETQLYVYISEIRFLLAFYIHCYTHFLKTIICFMYYWNKSVNIRTTCGQIGDNFYYFILHSISEGGISMTDHNFVIACINPERHIMVILYGNKN